MRKVDVGLNGRTNGVQGAGRIGFRGEGEGSWSSGVLERFGDGDDVKSAAFAIGAAVGIAPGEATQEMLPAFPESGIRRGRSG